MFKVHAQKIFLTVLVLCVAASMLQAVTSPITSDHASIAVTYQKPSNPTPAPVTVKFTASSSTDFVIDPSTVPFWLSPTALGGTATSGGVNITFDSSSTSATLNAGGYNGSIHVKVSGFPDLVIPVSLTVSDPASTLSIAEGSALTIHWKPGDPDPVKTLTMVSSDAPIGFTVVAVGTSPAAPSTWVSVNHTSGVAYTYGSPITVNFLFDVLYNAAVGASLTGTVTVTPIGTGQSPVVFTYTISVDEPAAAITRIFPSQTPVQALPGTPLKVIVTGSGFGTTGGYSGKPTTVSIAYGAVTSTDVTSGGIGGAISVANQNTLVITIPVQDLAGTPNDILSAAQDITISIQNGNIGSAVTTTLTVTAKPLIYTLADAASIVEPAAPTNPTVAPYELITIFGDNFGPTGSNVVNASLDTFSRYPTTLATGGHNLSVAFWNAAGSTKIADAYLLFASKTQINALVPSGVTVGQTDRIVVTYNALDSAASPAAGFPVTIAAQNPGIFTVTSSGTGQGAILLSDFSLNSSSNKAAKGSTVLIYASGLGAPNSTAVNTVVAAKATFPTTCISPASYMATINTLGTPPNPLWTTVDGSVIQAAKLTTNHFPPCMATANAVTVTIGGLAATVTYAGWVGDSVAGLYQINATLSKTVATGNAIPVAVTVGGVPAQTGVTMAVQ